MKSTILSTISKSQRSKHEVHQNCIWHISKLIENKKITDKILNIKRNTMTIPEYRSSIHQTTCISTETALRSQL